jgi:hypothetical protein
MLEIKNVQIGIEIFKSHMNFFDKRETMFSLLSTTIAPWDQDWARYESPSSQFAGISGGKAGSGLDLSLVWPDCRHCQRNITGSCSSHPWRSCCVESHMPSWYFGKTSCPREELASNNCKPSSSHTSTRRQARGYCWHHHKECSPQCRNRLTIGTNPVKMRQIHARLQITTSCSQKAPPSVQKDERLAEEYLRSGVDERRGRDRDGDTFPRQEKREKGATKRRGNRFGCAEWRKGWRSRLERGGKRW